ncbi:MAG: hypothetical protein ACK6DB_20320, partial [Planctomycetota bacterium]
RGFLIGSDHGAAGLQGQWDCTGSGSARLGRKAEVGFATRGTAAWQFADCLRSSRRASPPFDVETLQSRLAEGGNPRLEGSANSGAPQSRCERGAGTAECWLPAAVHPGGSGD